MNKIKIMSTDLANKIAAGEVIENQASIVKELVENSIDAKAKKIEILLLDSGFQLIQVIDNGKGMSKDDLLLCYKPHATSKLESSYDLFNIDTLGFRGEALASIASIAKVKISSNDGESDGYNLDINEDSLTEGYQKQGTKVAVYNLFYNVPARLKYLHSQKSELANIIDIIGSFALIHPDIAFSLVNDNKILLSTPGNNELLQVINNIYSLDITRNMEVFNYENNDFKLSGYLGNNKATRSNKRGIHIFINQRLVYNKELENAIIRGYGDYLMEKRYPIIVLNITCDYQLIDVNVHPAKLEVRIANIEDLVKLIEDSIKDVFKISKQTFITKPAFIQPSMEFSYVSQSEKPTPINYPNQKNSASITNNSFEIETPKLFKQEEEKISDNIKENSHDTNYVEEIKDVDFVEETTSEYVSKTTSEVIEIENKISLNVIGQFDATYILAQSERGLHLVDQHAAMERINYEKLLKNVSEAKLEYQELITPIIIPLTLSEKVKVLVLNRVLSEVGINVEEQANNDLIVRRLPSWVDNNKASEYVEATIDYVLALKDVKITDIKKENLIMASCKMSLKANHPLSVLEQQALLDKLIATNNYDHCPHGRPIIVTLSRLEIDKMFKRVI
ncbi:DNA mismatch repair endonuclease MutL [Erysipelotrichaceae bacterium OttesenSCG-928-M19]|nr:DNA mismatch repair endonuclease MutL [Erysipelotrichaceae bacterium OttesenSCG-928-M19]